MGLYLGSKLSLILVLCVFCGVLFYFWSSKKICSPPVCTYNDTKSAQFLFRNEENIGKCLMIISTCLVIDSSTLP